MEDSVKSFIETNIDLIENQHYEELYDKVYMILNNHEAYVLNNILEKILGVDARKYAIEEAYEQLIVSGTFLLDDGEKQLVKEFIRMYMLSTCGIPLEEFLNYAFVRKDKSDILITMEDNEYYIQKNKK